MIEQMSKSCCFNDSKLSVSYVVYYSEASNAIRIAFVDTKLLEVPE